MRLVRRMTLTGRLRDSAAASAAMAINFWPDWAVLTPSERYERVRLHIEASFLAMLEAADDFRPPPEPSTN